MNKPLTHHLTQLTFCLMFVIALITLFQKIDKRFGEPLVKIEAEDSSDNDFGHKIPQLRHLGLLDAANQGPYKITGYQHVRCEGSIALLPLYRNAEGSHILRRLIIDDNTRFGIIFKGEIHSEFPQYLFIKQRFTSAFNSMFATSLQTNVAAIKTFAFAEQGSCQIAEKFVSMTL